jgi:hypothetical protein
LGAKLGADPARGPGSVLPVGTWAGFALGQGWFFENEYHYQKI